MRAFNEEAFREDGGHWYRLHYRCPHCSETWTDEWSCTVDDECPNCGTKHVSPLDDDDLSEAMRRETGWYGDTPRPWRVVWEIDVEATSAEEAARMARGYQTKPGTTATVFACHAEGLDPVTIDLTQIDEDAAAEAGGLK